MIVQEEFQVIQHFAGRFHINLNNDLLLADQIGSETYRSTHQPKQMKSRVSQKTQRPNTWEWTSSFPGPFPGRGREKALGTRMGNGRQ